MLPAHTIQSALEFVFPMEIDDSVGHLLASAGSLLHLGPDSLQLPVKVPGIQQTERCFLFDWERRQRIWSSKDGVR